METHRKTISILFLLCFIAYFHSLTTAVILNERNGVFESSDEVNNTDKETIWNLQLDEDCEIDLELRRLILYNQSFISISSGPNPFNGSKTMLLTENYRTFQFQKLRLADHEAFVILHTLTENSSIDFEFVYNCSTTWSNSQNMTIIQKPFDAPDNLTISLCIPNMNKTTAEEMLDKDNATHKQFLESIAKCPNDPHNRPQNLNCDVQHQTFTPHFHWPMFGQYDCKFSSKQLPIQNRYCVCFNLSIEIEDGNAKCNQKLLTNKQLKDLLINSECSRVNAGDETFELFLNSNDLDVIPYILIAVVSLLLGLILSSVVYKYAWLLNDVTIPTLESRGSAFEEEIEQMKLPSEIRNPLYETSRFSVPNDDGVNNPSYVYDGADNFITMSVASFARPQTTQLADITEEEEDAMFGGVRGSQSAASYEDIYETIGNEEFFEPIKLDEETQL